jgi:large subunit ribosomal protein L10e
MAASKRLRSGHSYRQTERAYTRMSKRRGKAFVKSCPAHKIAKFVMGNEKKQYDFRLDLNSKGQLQIRHNALEAARQVINRRFNENVGPQDYHLILRVYPHQIQRENKLYSGASKGDRVNTGMSQSFGTPIGRAAQIKIGQTLFTVFVNERHVDAAKKALMAGMLKLPYSATIEVKPVVKK